MQGILEKKEQKESKPVILQGKLNPDEQAFIRTITNYSQEINNELRAMGFSEVRSNKIHQVIGGFHGNSSIEIASRRVIKKYKALSE